MVVNYADEPSLVLGQTVFLFFCRKFYHFLSDDLLFNFLSSIKFEIFSSFLSTFLKFSRVKLQLLACSSSIFCS